MIGEIRKALTPFYDAQKGKMAYKSRPALVIAMADSSDYIVLPVSTISRPADRHPLYDVEIDLTVYPLLNLDKPSFVRTHKQTVIYASQMGDMIGNMRVNYEELYLSILEKREAFSAQISTQAIG